jgi:hypothetical protein
MSLRSSEKRRLVTSIDFVKPWRLLTSVPPFLYGGLLLLGLPMSLFWFLLTSGVVLSAAFVAAYFELPILGLWPALVGLFLLSVCICALDIDVVDYAIVPVTDSDFELILVALIACVYIVWGVQTTRAMMVD